MRGTVIVEPGALPTATGPKPPTGTIPGGFKPGQSTTGTTPSNQGAESSGTDWTTIAVAVGLAAFAAGVVLLLALLRRRRAAGG